MRFELLSLKLFVAVCEQRSIARAAELEHIAASAVSKRISDLEKDVKAPLFVRRPHGLELTAAGDTLLLHARGVLRDLTQMEADLADHSKGVRGLVHIYASVSTIVQHLPRDIADFMKCYPLIRIKIRESVSPSIVRAVAENEADIGILGGNVPVSGLHTVPYRTDRLVVLMASDHALANAGRLKFAQIAEHPMVLPKTSTFLDSLIMRAAADLSHPLQISIRLNGFETTASMVEAGLGIALVPEGQAARYVQTMAVTALPFDEAWAVRQWRVCTQKRAALPAPVRLMLDHLSNRPETRAEIERSNGATAARNTVLPVAANS